MIKFKFLDDIKMYKNLINRLIEKRFRKEILVIICLLLFSPIKYATGFHFHATNSIFYLYFFLYINFSF
jgi:hypothetical protein